MKIKNDYITPEERTSHQDIIDKVIVSISFMATVIQIFLFFIS